MYSPLPVVIVRSTLVCDGEHRALALTEKEEEISFPMASFQQRGPALGTHISASHGWGQLDSTCVRSCVRVKILDRDSNEAMLLPAARALRVGSPFSYTISL